jgi:hypothetical protein
MGFDMVFDATITIGNVIEILTIAGGGFLFLMRTGGDIRVMKTDMTHLKGTVGTLSTAFDKLGTVLTQVAVQDTRLVSLEKRLDELAHGRGFVQGVNREYP